MDSGNSALNSVDIYPHGPPGNDYGFGGPSGYSPTWNLYDDRYDEYTAQNRQMNGTCMARSQDWQVPRASYQNIWNHRDIHRYIPQPHQDIYAIPGPCIDTQPNNLLPPKWWYQGIVPITAEYPYTRYPQHNLEGFFRPTAYNSRGGCTSESSSGRICGKRAGMCTLDPICTKTGLQPGAIQYYTRIVRRRPRKPGDILT